MLDKDIARFINIPEYIKPRCKLYNYDKCLEITIPGDPMADSRPRFFRGVAISLNLLKLAKDFKPLYEASKILKNTMIHSKYSMEIVFYMKTTKKDYSFIKKDKKLLKIYASDKLPDMSIKDVDNMCKVYNDLLFIPYRVCLDDAYNVSFFDPCKFVSENPRTAIRIYYNSKPNEWERYKIYESAKYEEHILSLKHMEINKRTPSQQLKHLERIVTNKLNSKPNKAILKAFLVRFATVLREYPSDIIKTIAYGEDQAKYTKYDALVKIHLMCLKKHKELWNTFNKNLAEEKNKGGDELVFG